MHVVATTIASPVFLQSYLENFRAYDRLKDVKMWVAGDLKSPAECDNVADSFRKQGLDVEYLGPSAQSAWLQRFPDLDAIIPWNSDNRRNVGFLRALEQGCEILVAVDDDNYPLPDSDFYAGHAHAGEETEVEVLESPSGWYNICQELTLHPPIDAIPRGYPYAKRTADTVSCGIQRVRTVANAGLWLGDPDVDAATRLTCKLDATAARKRSIALAPGTWSPVNTQNTAVARRAIPAYYYVRMLEDLPGAKLDRYGDIWSGYFLTRCAEHLGDVITIGLPLVRHIRNLHDLMSDLRCEIWGMVTTPHLIDALRSATLTGTTYSEVTISLAGVLQSRAQEIEDRVRLTELAAYLHRIAGYLKIWVDVCQELS